MASSFVFVQYRGRDAADVLRGVLGNGGQGDVIVVDNEMARQIGFQPNPEGDEYPFPEREDFPDEEDDDDTD